MDLATAVPASVRVMTGKVYCPKNVSAICGQFPASIRGCNNGYAAQPAGNCTCNLHYTGDYCQYLVTGARGVAVAGGGRGCCALVAQPAAAGAAGVAGAAAGRALAAAARRVPPSLLGA